MTQELGVMTTKESKGRHPLLKTGSIAFSVYTHLKKCKNEGLPAPTYIEIARAIREEDHTVNGALQRMKGHGLVVTVPRQKGNRVVSTYELVEENVTGNARDEVRLRVTILVNSFGEYSAQVMVVGQSPLAHESSPVAIHQHEVKITVPRPREPYKTRTIIPAVPQLSGDVEKSSLTIDGEIGDISK